jgi:hypothetical protein
MVKSIHTEGFKAPITDVDILKCIGQTENWTFEDRIGMICHVLKVRCSLSFNEPLLITENVAFQVRCCIPHGKFVQTRHIPTRTSGHWD